MLEYMSFNVNLADQIISYIPQWVTHNVVQFVKPISKLLPESPILRFNKPYKGIIKFLLYSIKPTGA